MPAISSKDLLLDRAHDAALPLYVLSEANLSAWRASRPEFADWLTASGFKAERSKLVLLPDAGGKVAGAILGLGKLDSVSELTLWHTAGLAERLPALDFYLEASLPQKAATQAALGFAYGEYRYNRYRLSAGLSAALSAGSGQSASSPARRGARLVVPFGCDTEYVERAVQALAFARDLINTPASDMGPDELAAQTHQLAKRYGAQCETIDGPALLEKGYPAIHAVGRASPRAPRLIDLRWGAESDPRLTLVGKGVCFDTGGLDMKNAQSMLLMKKDMGGAACALGLAQMIMDAGLPVRLRVLIPAVENSVAGDAYRPGDVLQTRKGITVEVGNTDAEGRLVLCDALAEADREKPALLIDFATLTGAARVALGPELPALYANKEEWQQALFNHGRSQHDPMWSMPLWSGYEEELSSKIADANNVGGSAFAGSIVAALFLRRFVSDVTPWLHLDLFAWNAKERPGRPVGAEAQCVRAVYALLEDKFGREPAVLAKS